jgi:hypothetical protein
LGSQSCTLVKSISQVHQSSLSGKKKKAQAEVQKRTSSSGSAKKNKLKGECKKRLKEECKF